VIFRLFRSQQRGFSSFQISERVFSSFQSRKDVFSDLKRVFKPKTDRLDRQTPVVCTHPQAALPRSQMAASPSGQMLVAVAGALLLCAACAMVLALRRRPQAGGKQRCRASGRRPATRSPTKAAEAARLKRRQELEGEFRAKMVQLRQDGLVWCGRVIEQPTFAGLTTELETCHEETEYEGYEGWYDGSDSWMSSEVAAHGSFSACAKESLSRVCSPAPSPSTRVGKNGDAPQAPAARGRCSPIRGRVGPAAESASVMYSRSI
jgi:hypothetical protein